MVNIRRKRACVRGTHPSVRDGKATNDLCKLVEHGFGIPVIGAEHGVDRVGDKHPLVSEDARQRIRVRLKRANEWRTFGTREFAA